MLLQMAIFHSLLWLSNISPQPRHTHVYRYRHVSRLPQRFVDGGSGFPALDDYHCDEHCKHSRNERRVHASFEATGFCNIRPWASQVPRVVVKSPQSRREREERQVGSLGGEGPLEQVTHSCIPASEIPRTEGPSSPEAGRAGRDCLTVSGALHAGPPAAPGDRPTQEAASRGLLLVSPASSLRP